MTEDGRTRNGYAPSSCIELLGLKRLPPCNFIIEAGGDGGQLTLIRAISIHQPDAAGAAVGDGTGIGCPDGIRLASRRVGQAGLRRAIGVHAINLSVAIAGGHEQNLAAIGCP